MAKIKNAPATDTTPETAVSTATDIDVASDTEAEDTVNSAEGTPSEDDFGPGEAPEGFTQVVFSKPDKNQETFLSTRPTGYTVNLNDDRRAWTISYKDEVISTTTIGRKTAFAVADAHMLGKPTEVAPVVSISSANEAKVIDYIIEKDNAPQTITVLSNALEMDFATVMGIFSNLNRRAYLIVDENGAVVTDKGKEARVNFNPEKDAARLGKRIGPKGRSPKSGVGKVRPEGIGPLPSALEFAQVRLDNAEATMRYTLVLQRIHPFSDIIKGKLEKAQERIDLIKVDVSNEEKWEAANGGKHRSAGARLSDEDVAKLNSKPAE